MPTYRKLMVVADQELSRELVPMLGVLGFADPVVADGDARTVALFESTGPEVVVLSGRLESAESLAEAFESGRHGRRAKVVWIGAGGGGREPGLALPVTAESLGQALDAQPPGRRLTADRLAAATDQAIESFLEAAMTGLQVAVESRNTRELTAILERERASPPNSGTEADGVPFDELDGDLSGPSMVDVADLAAIANGDSQVLAPEPRGGDFARQLRRKMSAMAERLFPGDDPRKPAFDARPYHDEHVDIDLNELGVDTVALAPEPVVSPVVEQIAPETGSNTLNLRPPTTQDTASLDGTSASRGPMRGELGPGSDVASVLGRFSAMQFTGQLLFQRGAACKEVYFEDGRVVFASSNLDEDRMGDLLYREGTINREQYERCRELSAESGRRAGEVLVDLGFLKPRELLPSVRRHLEDIFYSIFGWTTGSYQAAAGEPLMERIRVARHPAVLVLEGIRRKYSPARLEACLGGPQTIVVRLEAEASQSLSSVVELATNERRALSLLDGEHTLDEVAEACDLDELAVAQLALAVLALGQGKVVDRGQDGLAHEPSGGFLIGESDLQIDRQRVMAKHALVEEADYFKLLGVRPDASRFEIRRAYESASQYFAAESFPMELRNELDEKLRDIGEVIEEAYRILRDDDLRASYRKNLHP